MTYEEMCSLKVGDKVVLVSILPTEPDLELEVLRSSPAGILVQKPGNKKPTLVTNAIRLAKVG